MVTTKVENSSSQLAAAANVKNIWGSIFFNVKASPYNAKGDNGVTDDSAAIQAAINAVIAAGASNVYFPPGIYKGTGLVNTESVNFVGDGARFLNNTYAILPFGMQAKSQRLGKGQNSGNFFVSTEGTHKEIADIDTVALHVVSGSRTQDGVDYDRVWGINSIVAKHIDTGSSYVVGCEVSMVNDTTDHGDVIGYLSSYVALTQGGKSAFESTANIASSTIGWNFGMLIDGIKTTGTGLILQDNDSSNGGMSAGIDLSPVQSYTNGAVLLGNGHIIKGKATNGTPISLMMIDAGDNLVLGGAGVPTAAAATVIRAHGSAGVVMQNKDGSVNLFAVSTASASLYINGGFKEVTVGAADSAGAGFRQLRVPN